MLIGRHDIEKLMRLDPASACLPNAVGQSNINNHATDAETVEVELELCDLLLNLRPIKQVNIVLFSFLFSKLIGLIKVYMLYFIFSFQSRMMILISPQNLWCMQFCK